MLCTDCVPHHSACFPSLPINDTMFQVREIQKTMSDHVKLLEPMELAGFWWLPDRPRQKVHGRLAFGPNRDITVELDGRLVEKHHPVHQKWPIVHGETRDGIPCSLLRVLEHGRTIGPHTVSSRISANYGLLGTPRWITLELLPGRIGRRLNPF